jgi:hypothetical protein
MRSLLGKRTLCSSPATSRCALARATQHCLWDMKAAVGRGSDEALLSRTETWALVACQPLPQLSNMALKHHGPDAIGPGATELGW